MKKLLLLLLVLSSFSAFSTGENEDEEAICNQINDEGRSFSSTVVGDEGSKVRTKSADN